MEGKIIGGQFQIKNKIGAGSFGEIYVADDFKTLKEVAIKIDTPKDQSYQLSSESKIYSILDGEVNIPKAYWYGQVGKRNALVMELLGKSIQDRFVQCNRRFSLKTVLMLAEQMLSVVEYVHSRHFVHRDIKPNNFVFGSEINHKQNQIYLIDFGLARKYRNPQTLEHEQFCLYHDLSGTARYASLNALKGAEQSRRDDLESLGYIFVYFLKGYLPWMGIEAKDSNHKNFLILQKKQSIKIEELCEGLPEEFSQYFHLVRKLKFKEEPNYSQYRELFRNLFIKQGYVYDYKYDWTDLVVNTTSSIQSKKRTLRSIKSSRNLPLIERKMVSNENSNENIVAKRIPIISNKRLVPNYETGKRNQQNSKPKPKQIKKTQRIQVNHQDYQFQPMQFLSPISKTISKALVQPNNRF